MKKVLVPIANGSEEIESVCIIDTLRRAGADVTGALAAPTSILWWMLNLILVQWPRWRPRER